MSSHKLIPMNCAHSKGYNPKDDRCVDCGVAALPSVVIEHLHQQLLKTWVRTQVQPADDSGVSVPFQIMAMTRMQATEMYLDKQHELAEAIAFESESPVTEPKWGTPEHPDFCVACVRMHGPLYICPSQRRTQARIAGQGEPSARQSTTR